ncbi:hypothetical protein GEV33_002720 [Tenebrio molitor]|uniref:Receptor ligand binding region domain-containing protein n=1 Tax=Tenebrio molitor TaxID=7067 RepID=A0A8J6LEM0_TENMO|nr:hypothetical protein GEV33_002720 [Tenebrio molitor]
MPFRPIWWRRCGLACDAIKIKWVAGLGRGFCYQLLVIAFCPSSIGLAAECVRFILGVRSKKHARNNLRTGENLWGETCGRSEKRLHLSEVGVCHLLRSGVAAIFGPQSAHTASHVQSICDTMEIPHLETRWDYRLRRESCLVNLYPHPTTLSKAYVDLVKAWGWKSFTIIYENNEGLVRLQELLKAHGPYEFPITVRQLGESSDYRPLLKQIKNSAESHIVLDCSTERIYDVLKQAQQIGMMSDYHSYLITSLDLHGVDLEEFKYGGTNITAFRLVDPDGPEVRKVVREWNLSEAKNKKGEISSIIRAETALMYDAVHLFAKALHDLDTSQQIDIKPLSCDAVDTWPHGYSLINYMKIVEMRGLTGVIKFDHQGFRSDFVLDIIELSKEGLKKIGTWNSTEGVNFTRTYGEAYTQIVEIIQNKTFVVTTILRQTLLKIKYKLIVFAAYSTLLFCLLR